MNNLLKPTFVLAITALLTACDDGPSGVEQRLVELEARLASKEAENVDLRAKLDEARKAQPPESAVPASTEQASTRAGVFAAATILAENLKEDLKPRTLSVSGEVAYAGLTAKNAAGDEQGVAVPFFRDGEGSSWRSGWSTEQILAALGNTTSTARQASSAAATMDAPTPQPQPSLPQTVRPAPTSSTSSLPGLPSGWTFDSAANEVIAPTGARMPPAPPGWRYGIMEGAAGDTARAYIQGPQGQRKYYVN